MRVVFILLPVFLLLGLAAASADKSLPVTTRLLRTAKTATNNEEERMFGINLGPIDDFFQNQQLKSWISQNKRSDEVFKLLKLDEVGDDLLASSQWQVLTQYVTMLDKSRADENLVWALIRRYGTDGIPSVLAAAKKVPSTKDLATKLEATQMKGWLNSADPSPDNILKLLKLDNGADKLFETAQFATWTKYLDEFNTKFPDKKTSEVGVFVRAYGEGDLMKMLISKGNADSVIASNLKNEMLAKWLEFGTPPKEVFKLLKLDDAGDDLLSSPLLTPFVQYLKGFNEKIPTKKTTMIDVFTKSYEDEGLAKMLEAAKQVEGTKGMASNLQRAQFGQWMAQGKTPNDVLNNILKVDSTAFLDDATGSIWRAYNKEYAKKFPEADFAFQP